MKDTKQGLKARFAAKIGRALILKTDLCEHRFDLLDTKIEWSQIYVQGYYEKECKCVKCGEMFVPDTGHTLYDTPSGQLEPGCLYWDENLPENYYWDNHQGPHLCAVLPTGAHWVIDSRASNCGMPHDRLHRCWVRSGEIPNITVAKHRNMGLEKNGKVIKRGHTCKAGGGSIWANKGAADEWHGFLRNGEFVIA